MHIKAKGRPEEKSREYLECVADIIGHEAVRSMKRYNQHGGVDCLEHCLNVSVTRFRICKRLGLDYRSAARGGLLHDFFPVRLAYGKSVSRLSGVAATILSAGFTAPSEKTVY